MKEILKPNNSVLILVCIVILAFIGAFYMTSGQLSYQPIEMRSDSVICVKNDTVWHRDTIYITKLVPKETIIQRFDTIRKDTILPIIENKYNDTICVKGDTAILGITTVGYPHSVDSISLDLRKSELIKTVTIEKTISKQRRFTYGVQVGMGYGMWSKKPDMYVGVGLQINL